MNTVELKRRLEQEGCNPDGYGIGSLPGGYDGFSLLHEGDKWRVFYAERGELAEPPLFESESEEEACDFFFRHMMSVRQDHLVGFFRSQEKAKKLEVQLEQHGLAPHSDSIPYGGVNDPRVRVFVVGKDIFKAKELLNTLPVQD